MTRSSALATYSDMSCPPTLLTRKDVNAGSPRIGRKMTMEAILKFLAVDVGCTHVKILAIDLSPSRFLHTKKVRL
jgi:hypothetical protein